MASNSGVKRAVEVLQILQSDRSYGILNRSHIAIEGKLDRRRVFIIVFEVEPSVLNLDV
ncbi:MAG: hypothetical protein H6512_08550 [Acidimicrobiia bacterium]|nr:hypothetical protein [Acidimicrobiia bacterium]